MKENDEQILKIAKESARQAGELLLQAFGQLEPSQIDLKGKGDYVTELDRRAEQIIIDHIKKHFPHHRIQAEESGMDIQCSEFCWLIDPLDGTANYVHHVPIFAVSIGILKGDIIRSGVIYYPHMDEMFWAVKNQGAFLNGQPISVSKRIEMGYAMLATGFPWRSKQYIDPYIDSFKELLIKTTGIRRKGSAAIDLAYTACGRFDGFWEMKLNAWDLAAGVLLIEEAGGVVSDFKGGNHYLVSGNIIAGNKQIHQQILDIIKPRLSNIP